MCDLSSIKLSAVITTADIIAAARQMTRDELDAICVERNGLLGTATLPCLPQESEMVRNPDLFDWGVVVTATRQVYLAPRSGRTNQLVYELVTGRLIEAGLTEEEADRLFRADKASFKISKAEVQVILAALLKAGLKEALLNYPGGEQQLAWCAKYGASQALAENRLSAKKVMAAAIALRIALGGM